MFLFLSSWWKINRNEDLANSRRVQLGKDLKRSSGPQGIWTKINNPSKNLLLMWQAEMLSWEKQVFCAWVAPWAQPDPEGRSWCLLKAQSQMGPALFAIKGVSRGFSQQGRGWAGSDSGAGWDNLQKAWPGAQEWWLLSRGAPGKRA